MNEDPIACIDQAVRAVVDVMRLCRATYEVAVAQGFNENQAFSLAKAHYTALVSPHSSRVEE